ncbi:MAG: ArsR family transcriptional regulator [Promethearchaeota archaeon]
MSHDRDDLPPGTLFESAMSDLIQRKQRKQLVQLGYQCDPCDPLLPLHQPMAFYGETNPQFKSLIIKIIEFIQDSPSDILFLKGPRGSGKTIFARIFEEFRHYHKLNTIYQDASHLFNTNVQSDDILFLDNAFRLHKTLLSLNSSSSSPSPKIIAIMDSTEFEIYRRLCIPTGDISYRHFLVMPSLTRTEIEHLLQRRLNVCATKQDSSHITDTTISNIASLALGNPGVAIQILKEHFYLGSDGLRFTFGINPKVLSSFPRSKISILREILVREVQVQNELDRREYIIHKELTYMMNKTKSTISHHLADLLNSNLIYEQSTDRDKREKAYRPNRAIFGILEHLAFESSITKDARITPEGIYHED